LIHYNYFRDYDPGVGRYLQADPLRLSGLLKRGEAEATRAAILATFSSDPNVFPIEFRADLFNYVYGSPINRGDVRGDWSWAIAGAVVGAAAAGGLLYVLHKCAEKCDKVCPFKKDSNDEWTEVQARTWTNRCIFRCGMAFGELAKGGPW